eukprot:Plantae.Rhodophyta-Purpureofilum_apyrenoidigerum.ctg5054.p1 GENE.Plantae.Rhodophyta-Purpureofilum_apyrenoidigerum.ctg5054~~Plantae.Rhodophyta-Purpureofilum_apyrenoidigerum.ctg5054.p1  ORF type:complete len:311 (-),score=34.54 Plantae.Rhodophyta-Purpureofilum_apyrenoidigerum.ctg5054:120-926(-)
MAIEVVPKSSLYVSEPDPSWFGNGRNEPSNPTWTNENWLKSRFHFSFAEHISGKPKFGCLRVMNDDLVQPSRGFGTHPHSNMEIITYVVHGKLSHKDSMGTVESLGRGSIQFMTAGTGVMHSEFNDSATEPLRFVQMWITPNRRGLRPNYGSAPGDDLSSRQDTWDHLVAPTGSQTKAKAQVNQDVNMYVAELSQGAEINLPLGPSRQAYVLAVEGSHSLAFDGQIKELHQQDAAEIVPSLSSSATTLSFKASNGPAHLLVVEMARTS